MTNQERLQANNAKIEAIQQTLANKVITSGEIEIVENGKYDVSKYASANVNVPIPDLSATTATESDVLEGKEFFNASGEKVTGTYVDGLQWKCDNINNISAVFSGYKGDSSELQSIVNRLDVSNVLYMEQLFKDCTSLTNLDLSRWEPTKVKNMNSMFYNCNKLINLDLKTFDNPVESVRYMFYKCNELKSIDLSNFDTSNVTDMNNMFSECFELETIICNFDTRLVTSFQAMFSGCKKLVTAPVTDMRKASQYGGTSSMFNNCTNLTNLTLKNIVQTMAIGNGTTWGHLLTLDSLLNTIKELHISTSTRTLTVGSANLEKLANVYVKLVDITDEMRAEDEYIDNKAPFVQCESTDEGAMLITEYVTTVKNWNLA